MQPLQPSADVPLAGGRHRASSTATVNGVGYGIGAISQRLRHVQTGLVTNYALAIALGMVVLVGIYLGFSICSGRRAAIRCVG